MIEDTNTLLFKFPADFGIASAILETSLEQLRAFLFSGIFEQIHDHLVLKYADKLIPVDFITISRNNDIPGNEVRSKLFVFVDLFLCEEVVDGLPQLIPFDLL